MNHRHPSVSTAGVFGGDEVTAETMSDLFRPGTTLPHWEQTTSQVYSSSISMTSRHDDSTLKGDHDSDHSGEHFNSYPSSGNGETYSNPGTAEMDFPITSPLSSEHHIPNGCDNEEDSAGEPRSKRQRVAVPEEKKDNKYWDRRRKNNQAAKRSRDTRKKRIDEEIKTAKEAISENQKLKQEIDVLKAEINSLRRLLKDANMTLSLWIKARQASEPNSQLPPMLRGPNLSFVNFPVSTAIN